MTTPLKTGEDFVPLVKSIEIPTVDPNYLKTLGLISKSITQSKFISDYINASNSISDKISKSILGSDYLKVSGLVSKSITQSSFISDYLKTSNLVFDKISNSLLESDYLKVSGLISKSIAQSKFISDYTNASGLISKSIAQYIKASNSISDKINKSTLESIQNFLDDSKIDSVLKITSAFRAFQYLDQDTLTNYTVKPATQALYDRFKEAGGLDVWVSLTPDEAFDKINVFDDSISFDQVEISKQELNSLASIELNNDLLDPESVPFWHKYHPNSIALLTTFLNLGVSSVLTFLLFLLNPYFTKWVESTTATEKQSKLQISTEIQQMSPEIKAQYLGYKVVFSTNMNVYQTPKKLSQKVAYLPIGAVVKIEKEIKDWSLVEFDDSESDIKITGWVLTRYLRKIR